MLSVRFLEVKVSNGLTDTNPAATVFMTVQRERWLCHPMIVYQLVESEVKEGADVICGAECKL
jgi:hypothetical protein